MKESRTALSAELAAEINNIVLKDPLFRKLVQNLRRGGKNFRISLRPILLRGEKTYQAEMTDDGQTSVKNFTPAGVQSGLQEILEQIGPRTLHVLTAAEEIQIRITKKGKPFVSRTPVAADAEAPPLLQEHDRVKHRPLDAFNSSPLLKALGIAAPDGTLRASMRGKYDQINEFLAQLDATLKQDGEKQFALPEGNEYLAIADCGCGKSYLSFALHQYITHVYQVPVKLVGIDKNTAIIENSREIAKRLALDEEVSFIESDINTAKLPFRPDIVTSLHACDTATDDALARAAEWKSRYILCSPCCQHDLQKQMKTRGPMKALLRHGILRERLADILTDTMRTQILRIIGFRVKVVEFVSSEATARNILIRAEHALKPGQIEAVREYIELRDAWGVTPYLQTRLADLLNPYFTT